VPFGLGTILRRGTGFAGLWLPQTVVSVEFVQVSPLVPPPQQEPVSAGSCSVLRLRVSWCCDKGATFFGNGVSFIGGSATFVPHLLYESVVLDGGFSFHLSEL